MVKNKIILGLSLILSFFAGMVFYSILGFAENKKLFDLAMYCIKTIT